MIRCRRRRQGADRGDEGQTLASTTTMRMPASAPRRIWPANCSGSPRPRPRACAVRRRRPRDEFNGRRPHADHVHRRCAPAMTYIKAGTLRGLAVMSAKRSPRYRTCRPWRRPAFSDQDPTPCRGADAGRNAEGDRRPGLQRDRRVVELPDIRERWKFGVDAVGNTPEEFAARIKAEIAKWEKVIKDANIRLN